VFDEYSKCTRDLTVWPVSVLTKMVKGAGAVWAGCACCVVDFGCVAKSGFVVESGFIVESGFVVDSGFIVGSGLNVGATNTELWNASMSSG
jgi:hypothetical protein